MNENIIFQYNNAKSLYEYYSECIYEECIKGCKTQDDIWFASRARSLQLEEKKQKYLNRMNELKLKHTEYFI